MGRTVGLLFGLGARLQRVIPFSYAASAERTCGVRVFGVSIFVIGAVSLATLIIRRGRNLPPTAPDHLMLFVGIAGIITGLAVIFLRF